MKKPITHQEKVEWYSVLHKQNLNGRETEDQLFEAGISAGIEETIEEVFEWLTSNNYLTDLKETLIENFKNK